jgi:3'-phosphoadenosine 5'-phosphosulfate sulfotransferase (PAPS reductase)/FAD synthetase
MEDLRYFQAMPLKMKIDLTRNRIREWVREYGEEGCYVSFSGGKDSTVLLDIVRNVCGYKRIPAVFVDVPTQFPELKDFVKTFDNVEIIKPKISFAQVCEKYGFPLISKEVSECVEGARKYLTRLTHEIENPEDRQTDRQTDRAPYRYCYERITGTGKYSKFSDGPDKEQGLSDEELAEILNTRMVNKLGGNNQRLAIMLGFLTKEKDKPIQANPENRSSFSQEKYKFLLYAPFEISNKCCTTMKKQPAHDYTKKTGRYPIIATMASESKLRTQKWLQNGCNGFNLKIPTSNPMSFWTEQDVLLYIKLHNLPICSVYGDIVVDYSNTDIIEGQMSIADFEGVDELGIFEKDNLPLKTTGCSRTGCMLCGFGCHLEKAGEGRFEMLKESHPGMYKLLDVIKNNGVTMREAIDWVNKHGNLNIRY